MQVARDEDARPDGTRRRAPRYLSARTDAAGAERTAAACPSVMLVMADTGQREPLRRALEERGLPVVVPTYAASVETLSLDEAVDVIVVDRNSPWGDGVSLCVRLSALRSPPVILLMPDPDEADRIVGLEVGADDCLPRSVSHRELASRIGALARRSEIQREIQSRRQATRFAFAGFTLCLKTRELRTPDGTPVFLAVTELSLLRAFVENPREVLPRARLRSLVGATDATEGKRVIDWRISRLRRTLKPHREGAELIKTVTGRGYVLNADVRLICPAQPTGAERLEPHRRDPGQTPLMGLRSPG